MLVKTSFILTLVFLSIPVYSFGIEITVGSSGDYQTIQAAIDSATHDDEIIVSEGTYTENINFSGKNISLRSTYPEDWGVVEKTIITGDAQENLISFSGNESGNCIISGFTIIDGGYDNTILGNETLASIKNNRIIDNNNNNCIYQCNGTIENNIISNNFNPISSCHGVIQNNLITNNDQGISGCSGRIQNNIISFNQGNGIRNSYGIIQNNTIYGNTNYGLYHCQEHPIRNNIIWNNGVGEIYESNTPSYCCIKNYIGSGVGNISDDPGFSDPENGDFHLRSDSPCIDAGIQIDDLNLDYEGNGRPYDAVIWESRGDGSNFDIGVYEFIGIIVTPTQAPTVTPTPTPGNNIIHVPEDYSTIQEAINSAAHGDEIIVATGEYIENINLNGKNIILRSIDPLDNSIVLDTIINGNRLGSVVKFSGSENSGCVLEGFTITKGNAQYGGGIFGNGTNAIIRNNQISNNTVVMAGGGISNCNGLIEKNIIISNNVNDDYYYGGGGLYGCNGMIKENIIANNISNNDGGGLYNCHGTVMDCTISGNYAFADGGGLAYCNAGINGNDIINNRTQGQGGGMTWCPGDIENNLISSNSSYAGAGIDHAAGTIRNNVISYNKASRSGGGMQFAPGLIENNIIKGNEAFLIDNDHYYGLGGALYRVFGTIQNNLIVNNAAYLCGGLFDCTGKIQNNTIYGNMTLNRPYIMSGCTGIIRNCIIWGNSTTCDNHIRECSIPSYSCIENWIDEGNGNITINPLLVDPEHGDFHLQPDSPCIDAGVNVTGMDEDFEGELRKYGTVMDIGADEYNGVIIPTPTPSNTPTAAPTATPGNVFYVPVDYSSISEAVDQANEGDTIIVSPGIYYENIKFDKDVNITLQSTDPTDLSIVGKNNY